MASETAQELNAIKTALEALWPLEDDARHRAVAGIAGALGVGVSGGGPDGVRLSGAEAASEIGELGTPKQFLAAKAPHSAH